MSPQLWRFGDFQLDTANACVWQGDQRLILRPKAFDLLSYLVTHPNRLLSKENLLDAVWPDTIVSDTVLKTSIRDLRRALGESARTPQFIATEHRRGYRFIASVVEVEVEVEVEDDTVPFPVFQATRDVSVAPESSPISELPSAPASEEAAQLPGQAEAERRQLTLLVCGLVDSTALAEQLDPEDLDEVLKSYYAVCDKSVALFEGHIGQYRGDNLLVYFGYPRAYEDAAHRAVHTGLEIVRSMPNLNRHLESTYGIQLSVRIGIHTGLVMIGQGRTGSELDSFAVGAPLNTASRILTIATPDTVLVSEATYPLIQGYFDLEELGPHDLPEVPEPISLYRVCATSESQHRLDVQPVERLTPFVGRELEIRVLQDLWDQAKRGHGQVVLLSGEAGIGKSRLVRAMLAGVSEEPYLLLEGYGSPYHQHTAFYPLVDLFHRLLQDEASIPATSKVEQLDQLVRRCQLDPAQSVPLLADLLDLSLPLDRYPVLELSPQQQRQQTFETVLNLVLSLSQSQPIILFIEDSHWLDPSTLEWLGLLVNQGPMTSILTVITCRPEFKLPWPKRSHVAVVTLKQLSASHVGQMVQAIAGNEALAAAHVDQVVRTTDGVPLFVEEITCLILASSAEGLSPDDLKSLGSPVAIPVPTTLSDLLLARLDSVGEAKRTVQLGATIGREFSYSLLRDLSPLEEGQLQDDLSTLVADDLLYQRGSGQVVKYQFKHALIHDIAYQSLLRRTRQQIHAQVAELLESRFAELANTRPELLAHHYTEARHTEKAVMYWQRAGEYANARSAHREAVMRYEKALQALQQLPKSSDTSAQIIDLHLAIRTALIPLGDSAPVFFHMRAAGALAEELGDVARQGRIAVYWIRDLGLTGHYEEAVKWGQQALALSDEDVTLRMTAQVYLGQTYYYMGAYQDAVFILHNAFDSAALASLGDQSPNTHLGASIPAVNLRYSLINALTDLGRFDEGMNYGQEALQIAEPAGHSYSLYQIYSALASLSLWRGNLEDAISLLQRCLDICQEADLPYGIPYTVSRLGLAYVRTGRITEAVPYLEQAEKLIASQQTNSRYAMWLALLCEAYTLIGNLSTALPLAQEALSIAQKRQERGFQGYALRCMGQIAEQGNASDTARAASHYREALVLAQELGMRPLQAHCHHSLGTLSAKTSQTEHAHEALTTAIDLYRAMDMTLWIPQAEATLRTLGC